MKTILCKICGTPKNIHPSQIGKIATCGSPSCKYFYRSTEVSNRGVQWRIKQSESARKAGAGKWMMGRRNFHSAEAKSHFSERWLGSGNPRWKGGVTRSESHAKWMKANPERVNYYNRIRKAWRRGSHGSYTLGEWLALKRAYLFSCPACGKTEPEIKLTADHIVPIRLGGATDIGNIQPLCGRCNGSKRIQIVKFASSLIVAKFKTTIAA